jgi:hypothetical protein
MQIILSDLPKVSLNQWYKGDHWSNRKKVKDKYYWLIKSQFKCVLRANAVYAVDYSFHFKLNPLDASNCVAMVKMIEDIIFEDDKWDIVRQITISSHKSASNYVKIEISKQDAIPTNRLSTERKRKATTQSKVIST